MMVDTRLQQLEQEYSQELASTNTKFAFSGFGRSSVRLEDVVEVGSKHQERIGNLNAIIAIENQLKNLPPDSGSVVEQLSNALSSLEKTRAELSGKAKQRRQKLFTEVTSVGQLADRLFSYRLRGGLAKRYKPKSFKLKIKPIMPSLSTIKPVKALSGKEISNFGGKFKLSRLGAFGQKRNLSGKYS